MTTPQETTAARLIDAAAELLQATHSAAAAEQQTGDLTDERIAELNREAQDQGISGIAPSTYLARAVEREVIAHLAGQSQVTKVQAETTLSKICDLFNIGELARNESTILENVKNVLRRNNCLSAIEREFFMVPAEPDDDFPDDNPGEECLLNWGSNPTDYVEQFRAALAQIADPTAQEVTQQAAKAETAEQARVLAGCDCGCNVPVATDPIEMLEFLAGRFEHAGVSKAVADVYAHDIRKILQALAPTTSTVSVPEEVRNQVLEEAAKVCEKIAEERFHEYGIRESDTGATYYSGSRAEELETRDEEDYECVAAIRALKRTTSGNGEAA